MISGVESNNGGVHRLLKYLEEKAEKNNYIIINRTIKNFISNIKYQNFILTKIFKKIIYYNLYVKTLFIKRSIVLFIHPQMTGFEILFRLVENKNKVFLYVMDNSFFCIESYNYLKETDEECFRCISNLDNCHSNCNPFPVKRIGKEKNIKLLKKLKNLSNKIYFLAQNNNQKKLLKLHFGKKTNVSIVGLNTNEFNIRNINYEPSHKKKYNIVYHGSISYAKGINYFVNLSYIIPEYSFLIPCSKVEVEEYLNMKINASNLFFIDTNWEDYLKDIVKECDLVLVPSLWSAPIEGALIKSIIYNNHVAVVNSKYSFSKEIKNLANLILLDRDETRAALAIKKFFRKTIHEKKNKNVFYDFLSMNNQDIIFKTISNTLNKNDK